MLFSCCYKPRIIEDYIVDKTLGIGVFGKVKLGIHKESGKQIALKILNRNDYRSAIMNSFLTEVAALDKLNHHRIVKMYFHSYCNYKRKYLRFKRGVAVIGMELSRGALNTCLYTHFSFIVATTLFHQLLDAIEYCHSHNICHRDIKPSNILISHDYGLLLGDFGLSHLTCNKCSSICGSQIYMAPEIMNSFNPYDGKKVDIWSATVCYFYFLTIQYPFIVACVVDKSFVSIANGDWSNIIQKFKQITPECIDILTNGLCVNINKRYSAKMFLNTINKSYIDNNSVKEELTFRLSRNKKGTLYCHHR